MTSIEKEILATWQPFLCFVLEDIKTKEKQEDFNILKRQAGKFVDPWLEVQPDLQAN